MPVVPGDGLSEEFPGGWGWDPDEAGPDPDEPYPADGAYPQDPLDSSCPPEYIGVPLGDLFGAADGDGDRETENEAAADRAGAAAGFASGGPLDRALPGVVLASFADDVTGADGPGGERGPRVSDNELIGLLKAWQRIGSWAAAQRLAVTAELLRRRPAPGCQPDGPARMPERWGKFCPDELAAAMASSVRAADQGLALAHDLAARLPGTARALFEGEIDENKARIIAEATRALNAPGAAAVEALILPGIEARTPGQIRAALARAVLSVDPAAARRRREQAEKDARVELWREDAGTAALCGRDLPPADALAADQRITAYARELKAAGLDGTMDQLRARAFLDLALGVNSRPHAERAGEEPARATKANVNLTVPLATVAGEAERPGEAAGFGAVDPDVARQLARDAAADPRSAWCVTVTDKDGRPVGHGCARAAGGTGMSVPGDTSAATTENSRGLAGFVREREHGPPGGYGRWRLRLGGRELVVDIGPVPVVHCDHRDESPGYRPRRRLRHLVEVRDGECTWLTCRRPARRCDFDHAIPWEKGGRTCACNTGPCCRHHHQAKQAAGWRLEQRRPGEHTWITPSGRSYTSGPACYPV